MSLPRHYSNDRSQESRKLLEARRRISALSLHEKESVLEQSDARVNALVKRNHELAVSSYGGISSSSRSCSTPFPRVKPLLAIIALSFCSRAETLPVSTWMCPHDPSDVIAKIPVSYNCSRLILVSILPLEHFPFTSLVQILSELTLPPLCLRPSSIQSLFQLTFLVRGRRTVVKFTTYHLWKHVNYDPAPQVRTWLLKGNLNFVVYF